MGVIWPFNLPTGSLDSGGLLGGVRAVHTWVYYRLVGLLALPGYGRGVEGNYDLIQRVCAHGWRFGGLILCFALNSIHFSRVSGFAVCHIGIYEPGHKLARFCNGPSFLCSVCMMT